MSKLGRRYAASCEFGGAGEKSGLGDGGIGEGREAGEGGIDDRGGIGGGVVAFLFADFDIDILKIVFKW